MTFTDEVKRLLQKPLDPANVKPPAPGKYGEYIEGWKTIEEANRIFGFDGWTRETVEMVVVCEYETTVGRDNKPGWAVGYRAKVRVNVGGVIREGTAVGNGVSVQLYDAHESAAKEAETDAMKRALMTFGYPLGLALYDKSKANVQAPPQELPSGPINDRTRDWLQAQIDATGKTVGEFCKAFEVTSLKAITYENLEAVKVWLQENRKAA